MSDYDLYDLVIRAQRGSEEAMITIIDKFKPLLKREIATTNHNDRDDLEQIIIIRMVRAIKSYDMESIPDLSTFLQEIDKNK